MESYEQQRQRERAERAQRAEQFHTLAREIASHLDALYQPSEGYEGEPHAYGHMTHPNGWKLSIGASRDAGRIVIDGTYGQHIDGRYLIVRDLMTWDERQAHEGKQRPDEMTTAASKGGLRIAREIERRILPAVIDYTMRAQALRDAGSKARSERDNAVAYMLKHLPGAQMRDNGGTIYVYDTNGPSVTVEDGGRVRFDRTIMCEASQAVQIIGILKGE